MSNKNESLGDRLERIERKARISKMEEQIQEMSDGNAIFYTSKEMEDSPMVEQFMKNIIAMESGDHPSYFDLLLEAGISLPDPDAMDDDTLHAKLWEAIQKLGELKFFLSHTNHLTDRELYTLLWTTVLREEDAVGGAAGNYTFHYDVLGSFSEEDMILLLKYHLEDEMERDMILEDFEGEEPQLEEPPVRRDHKLPKEPDPWA